MAVSMMTVTVAVASSVTVHAKKTAHQCVEEGKMRCVGVV